MSNEHELAMADFITETGLALQEMKLLIEDGVFLYTEEASSLLNLARANDQYGVAETFSTIGSALYNLRALICNLQNDYVAEIKCQFSAESPQHQVGEQKSQGCFNSTGAVRCSRRAGQISTAAHG